MSKRDGSAVAEAPEAAPESPAEIQIDRIPVKRIQVPIIGETPLIVHRFSEKAKRQMLDNMQGKKTPKVNKDPAKEFEGAFYRFEDGSPGFPVIAFKAATVSAARFYGKEVTMTSLRQYLFFRGEPGKDGISLVRIEGEAIMREDVVRVGRGGTDLRYRPQFTEWRTSLDVTYVESALTEGSVLSLIDAGGMGVGVGEWRPEKRGDNGTYRVDESRPVVALNGDGGQDG